MKRNVHMGRLQLTLILVLLLIVPTTTSVALQEPPPLFRASLSRTGEVDGSAPFNNTTLWSYDTEDPVKSSPVVTDGRVYVGTMDGLVLCLDAFTGQLVWTYMTEESVESSPAVSGGKVYIGSDDTRVYCLDALTGELVWRTATSGEIKSSPAVVNGLVYVGSNDFSVHCFDALSGDRVWEFETGGYVYSSPSLMGDRVYFGSCDGNVYSVNASTGDLVWNYTSAYCPASPAVTDDLVIFGAYDGLVHYLNRTTGKQVHAVTFQFAEIYSSAGLFTYEFDEDHDLPMVFLATTDGRMVGIGPDGKEFWNVSHDVGITSSPLVVTEVEEPYDPFVVYGDEGGTLHAIEVYNPYVGRYAYVHNFVEWHVKLGSSIQSSPFMWHNRTYVGAETEKGGRVVCIGVIDPESEPYVEPIQFRYGEGAVMVMIRVHNLFLGSTRVMVEFEGETKEANRFLLGNDYLVTFNSTAPEGMKPYIIRVFYDDRLVLTNRGQIMSLVEGWDRVDLRISTPKNGTVITRNIFVVSGTASSNYTIEGVYGFWDNHARVFNCTGAENWTVALDTVGIKDGWHNLTIIANDGWRMGIYQIRIHIGEMDDHPSVGQLDLIALLILLVVLVALLRTKPPRTSEKASDR